MNANTNPNPHLNATAKPEEQFLVIEAPLGWRERLWSLGYIRKTFLFFFLAFLWEGYARWLDNTLLFPSLLDTLFAFYEGIRSGTLLVAVGMSLQTLLSGYLIGVVIAAVFSIMAITTKLGSDTLESLTAMLNPLPAIALLPLAMIWFGLGSASIIFVLIHSVLWPVALNTHSGFRSVSNTLRMVGRNYGLKGLRYVAYILIPAAFPSILAGLKIGWAFAWRTLVAAELVFGVTSGQGGIGWYIFQNKNILQIPEVFSGLLMVILVGLLMDNFFFQTVEKQTIRKWGMQT